MVRSPKCTCPKATELFSIIGKKWVLFVLYAIYNGSHTFSSIRASVGEANTKILTDRLSELAGLGLIEKCSDAGSYSLTQSGNSLTEELLRVAESWERGASKNRGKK